MSIGKDHCSAQYHAKELIDFLNELMANFPSEYFFKLFSKFGIRGNSFSASNTCLVLFYLLEFKRSGN